MNNNRLKIVLLFSIFLWVESVLIYYVEFDLGIDGILQNLIAIINPLGTILLVLGLSLYFKKEILFKSVLSLLFTFESFLLLANTFYYKEFNSFITLSTLTGAQKMNNSLFSIIESLITPYDAIFLVNLLLLVSFLAFGNSFIRFSPISKLDSIAFSFVSIFLILLNLTLAESNRPQLLGRTFDQTYIVKYLGLNFFTSYNLINEFKTKESEANISGNNISAPIEEALQNHSSPNKEYFGIAKRKNVIIIHLESFQQFLINSKINNQEVTPFLNSLYKSNNSISFPNFFHEVGQGKTSDAETMLETGLFGLPTGSFFTKQGTSNTLEAAPAILNQNLGYTSAVFHGNVGSFYSRNKVYKNMGYNYFFDKNYFDQNSNSNIGFGLKDKVMFKESIKYLEKLQQPFYVKYITLTNHYPFSMDDIDKDSFQGPNTSDNTVNNYFLTAHYLDSALKEFFDYLKSSGLYDKSIIILYGDHYGISDDKNKALAPLINKDPNTWNTFDDVQMQRVPFIINMNVLKGKIDNEYGGEIDVLPTILHLLGISDKNYVHLGTDLLSKDHNPNVVFRNNNFINKKYTYIMNSDGTPTIYDNVNGKIVNPDSKVRKKLNKIFKNKMNLLKLSDEINEKNLLRFYTPVGFKPTDPNNYDYDNENKSINDINRSSASKSTSILSENNGNSTVNLYQTDAPLDEFN